MLCTSREEIGMSSNAEMTVVTLLKRKPGMSREAFVDYYESRHAVLATRVVPGLIDYRRLYLDPDHMAFGMPSASPGYDVITILVFADRAAYQSAFAALSNVEISQQIAEDEEQLFDRTCIRAWIVDQRRSVLQPR
jgi:hypothetical protein